MLVLKIRISCVNTFLQLVFVSIISQSMCIFPHVKKIIHDYRRISVLRKPQCAGVFGRSVMLTGVIFLLWMVDGYMSWAGWLQPVTAFALQSPRMDGCRLSCRIIASVFLHTHTLIFKTLQGKSFLMQSPRMQGCRLSRLIMAAGFPRTHTLANKTLNWKVISNAITNNELQWMVFMKDHGFWFPSHINKQILR